MLDRIAPVKMKPLVQSLNSAVYNLANAFFQIVLGIVSDMNRYMTMLYALGVQILALIVNLPLVFHPLFRQEKKTKANGDHVVNRDEFASEREKKANAKYPLDSIIDVTQSTVATTVTQTITHWSSSMECC
jgi:hypothetical protein